MDSENYEAIAFASPQNVVKLWVSLSRCENFPIFIVIMKLKRHNKIYDCEKLGIS